MSRVHISDQIHTVTVEHDGDELAYVVTKAQTLWEETKPKRDTAGPAFGYSAERAADRGGFDWSLGDGGHPIKVT